MSTPSSFLKKIRLFKNWWRLVRGIRTFPLVLSLRDGTRFFLRDQSDYFMLEEVLMNDCYRLGSISDPDIVLDVGANIGTFSILVARKFPRARIVAIEPNSENVAALQHNIDLNGLKNIEVHHRAIGTRHGEAELHLDERHHGGHSLIPGLNKGIGTRTEKVRTVPLDSFPAPDALKVDCSGYEYALFEKDLPSAAYVGIRLYKNGDRNALEDRFVKAGYKLEQMSKQVSVFTRA
ncbi:MAG TPA: FkbM family methyltransferase [Candidatus Paceibacterota bacterium]|nr:FkbM family methyltransferase [Candidatus Paceibacterota bacterium]